jgi:hypothetical protein
MEHSHENAAPRRRRWVWVWLAILVMAAGAAAIAVHQSWIRIPPNWQPWGPVALDEPPTWFARYQINGLAAEPQACFAALDHAALDWRQLAERPIENGCGLEAGKRITRSHVPWSGPFDTTCAMAAALYWWEAEVQDLARVHMGSELARIDHLGSYACRNVNSTQGGRRSQHATANAIDIAGFRFADGRQASVFADWGEDSDEGRFLTAAHDAACDFFNTVLGPDYNSLHANHFHLDLGRARICR